MSLLHRMSALPGMSFHASATSAEYLTVNPGGDGIEDPGPMTELISNVLAARYASGPVVELWSPRHKVVLERRLWLAVLRAQSELGVPVPDGVIEAYEAVLDDVDLESIERRERVTRHDVKARIEEFAALAGAEHIHKGMTSRDLTENVEQLQVKASLELMRIRVVAALSRLAALASEHVDLV